MSDKETCIQKLLIRCLWLSFYGLLWLKFGLNVSLTFLITYLFFYPVLFIFSKRFRSFMIFLNTKSPFLRLDNPLIFGLDGARNIRIQFEATVDKCPIELGVWHLLPKSLIKKHRFALNKGDKDELNKIFEDELKKSDQPVFLYIHGISSTRAMPVRLQVYKLLQNLDVHVIAFDYRGFGDSTNIPPVKISLVEDSLVVYSWIRSLVGANRPVFVWGHSMGAGLTQRIFSKLKPYCLTLLGLKEALTPPRGLVLESGYNSNVEHSEKYILAQIVNWLPPLEWMTRNIILSSENRIIPVDYASSLKHLPILMLHSRDDWVIQYDFGLKLYSKHCQVRKDGGSPITFEKFDGCGHSDIGQDPRTPKIVQDFILNNK